MNTNETKIQELVDQLENLKNINLQIIEEKNNIYEKFRKQEVLIQVVIDLVSEQNKELIEDKGALEEKFRQQAQMHNLTIDFVFEQNKEFESIISKLKQTKS